MKETETLRIETDSSGSGKKKGGILHIIYILIILLLVAGAGYLYNTNAQLETKISEIENNIVQVTQEKEKLYTQLDSLESEITMHMGENAKLDSLLLIKQEEIQKIRRVLKTQQGDIKEIEKYKKQIEILRKTADQYIQENAYLRYQVDSLSIINTSKQQTIDTMEIVDFQKTRQLEELADKVEKGSQIRVGDMVIESLNRRNKLMTRARRVETFKVTGVMLKNVLATPGKKSVYIRITAPDGIVFSASPDNQFDYDGKTIMYTERKELTYNNDDVKFEVFYDATNDKLSVGTYKVVVFCDGNEIGSSQIELR